MELIYFLTIIGVIALGLIIWMLFEQHNINKMETK